MHVMNVSAIDLNLLPLLAALYREGQLTRAARRVGLSQPAASHALARLRDLAADPLFVRGQGGLVPTPRAEALREPVLAALAHIERAFTPESRFSASEVRRTFRISGTDYVELLLLPAVVTRCERDAPGIDLWCATRIAQGGVLELQHGELDLLVKPVRAADRVPGIQHRPLFHEDFVCVMRPGHPLADGPLTLDAYVAARHAMVAPGGTAGGVVDDALAALGLERRVVLRVAHFLVAPTVVASTDLVLTLPRRVAQTMSRDVPLLIRDAPLPLESFTMSLIWSERDATDPAHAWLRSAFLDAAAEVDTTMGNPGSRSLPTLT
ncbi:MAG: LysR family transcriptional regulator [Myxococcales bacterium]|nr:LysR family transcriptional regulator [Myxococcales bacterium]